MYIIGITGPTGAGKTIAMRAIEKQGALALDCDEIYHAMLKTNTQMTAELKARFENITTDGQVDTKKLASIVFKNPAELSALEAITHKYILKETQRLISEHEKQGGETAVICAIKLIETDGGKKCDTVICITAPQELRVKRLITRDGITREEAITRINAQKPEEYYKKNSDYTIENTDDDVTAFERKVIKAHLIDKWFYEHTDEMLSELGQLVAVNSVRSESKPGAPFGEKPRLALRTAQEMLEKHGLTVNIFNDMVITANYGPRPAKLGILTHLDIVAAGENWDTDPFTLIEKDGRLYGRGVMDNKGPAIASMYAFYCIRELFPYLKQGIKLIFGSGEETGFDDITQYLKAHPQGSEEDAMPPDVFSPDADFPLVNIEKGRFMTSFKAEWEKDKTLPRVISVTGGKTPNIVPNTVEAIIEGISKNEAEAYCKEHSEKTGVSLSVTAAKPQANGTIPQPHPVLTITAKGTAAHASRPALGKNAQTALTEMLAAMPFAESRGYDIIKALSRLFPYGDHGGIAIGLNAKDEISGSTTVNFGVLRFDEYGLSAGFDARTAICSDDTDLLAQTRSILQKEGLDITYYERKLSHHTPEESEFVQKLLRAYENHTGQKGECLCVGGLTYVHDIPGGVAFGAAMPGEDYNVHGSNEHIDKKHLIRCAKIFTSAILEVCN